MHLTHKIVGAQHTAHRICQRQRHSHRQAFRHSHHNERHGNHQCLKSVLYEIKPIELCMMRKIHNHPPHNYNSRDDIARNGDHAPKTVKLLIKRCFHGVVNLRLLEYLSVLGIVAYCGDFIDTMPFHHLRSAHKCVGPVCSFRIEMRFVCGLHA